MRNLHLMWMDSNYNTRLVDALNTYFPKDVNSFVYRTSRTLPQGVENCIQSPSMFSPEQIDQQSKQYDQIFFHSLFLQPEEILKLSDETASKSIWVVWGHDLYERLPNWKWRPRPICRFLQKWLQQRSVFYCRRRKLIRQKIAQFRGIAVAFPYDELHIRKKYGDRVPVLYGPYFSKDISMGSLEALRRLRLENSHPETNIMIGHCGSAFIQHEKYLKKLSRYRDDNIHIYLIMSYLASPKRIEKIRKLAGKRYRADQFTIITESMPQDEYFRFLTRMDIAIFPFRHQSALGNVKRLAYIGTKLYFHPDGVLAKGFRAGGVNTYDVREVGRVSFATLKANEYSVQPDAPLFAAFRLENCLQAWERLLDAPIAQAQTDAADPALQKHNG